jgi:hypothetical protein
MEETMEEVKSSFTLPNEVVTVKFVKKRKGMAANVSEDHVISGGMLSGSKKKFTAPIKRTGGIANILTNKEKEYLERETGIDLSIYGEFWHTFSVSLFKEDVNNTFNLNDPLDYISVRLLESLINDIARSWKERNNKATYQFAITRPNEITDERKVKLDIKKEAFKLYGKIEDDKDKLLGILKLLSNQPIAKNSTIKWIQGQVEEYVDNKPSSFVSIIKDPSFETKVLINKGIDSGVVIRNGNLYSTVDGLELCEKGEVANFANAVKYLDNLKHQDVRTLVEAKINNTK